MSVFVFDTINEICEKKTFFSFYENKLKTTTLVDFILVLVAGLVFMAELNVI